MNLKIKIFSQQLTKFIVFIGLFFVFFHASIDMTIFPFVFGFLYALIWANQKVWMVAPAYILAGILNSPNYETAIGVLCTIFFLIVPYLIHTICKKTIKKWELLIFSVLGQAGEIVFDIFAGISPILCVATLFLGELFLFDCICVFEAFAIRGFSNKLTNIEIVSLFSMIAIFCDGLSLLNIHEFSLLKLFVCFVVLMFAYCSTPVLTVLVGAISGIGAMLSTNNPMFVAPFLIWALICLLFKKRNKIYMAVSVIAVEIVLGLYFQLYYKFTFVELLPVVIAVLLFLAIPNSLCNEIAVVFNFSKERLAMKNIVNRNREILRMRLGNLSEIFNDMNMIYRSMLKKGMTLNQVQSILEQEIMSKICSFCPDRSHCHRTFADSTKKVFDELITISYQKGKATLLDIPSFLTSRCKQTSAILNSVNTLTAQYKKYIGMMKDVDTSKIIIAEQLQGVSKILSNLSKDVESNISFDSVKEGKILDELTYHDIICIDVALFQKDIWTIEVSLVVKNFDAEKRKIADVVSKVVGSKMCVYEKFSSNRPGYTVINLKTAPKFDCLFGVCQHTKNGSKVSGDSYSVVKLSGDKILFAISDGMGSGEKAQKTSDISISLVENFYKAGFDNDLILSTVNKLLNLHKEDIFSALDICVFDQKDGMVDFVKMASPNSYILNENELQTVETGSLPLGIVEESTPLVNKVVVQSRDMIVMFSDGVSDSFGDEKFLQNSIKNIETKNPQEFADRLIEEALSCNNGYAVDDMTVLVVKVLNF